MSAVKIFGYTDRLSVKAGESVSFHISAEGATAASAQLVRLIHGDENPAGPGFVEEEIACDANGMWTVAHQFTQVGSYLEARDPDGKLEIEDSFTLFAFISPNRPEAGRAQALLGRWDRHTKQGYGLGIGADGALEMWIGNGTDVARLRAPRRLHRRVWYLAVASFDAKTGCATLRQLSVINRYNSRLSKVAALETNAEATATFAMRPANAAATPFLMAGVRDRDDARGSFLAELYDGKIDRPGVYDRVISADEIAAIRSGELPPAPGLIAYWDTSDGYTDWGIGDLVTDVGPYSLNAMGHNRPVRGQTGWNWGGRNDCFRLAPEEYGGIEFHSDQLVDCNWKVTKSVELPGTLKSGVYAMRLRAGEGKGLTEDHVVFFVRPAVPAARIAFLVPTASYIAAGNEQLPFDEWVSEAVAARPAVLSPQDIELYARGEFGRSVNDTSADGEDVFYASAHRPLLTMRPKYRHAGYGMPWGLGADLSIVAWLEHLNYDYEIVTDEDLEREGAGALAPYRCVITGTRPEYYSEAMLDATEDFIARGGRYVYLGGSGYACNVAFRASEPWALECRKYGEMFKVWGARPGEYYMATNGQAGGGWKMLGRPAQKLVGVGFIAQGFESARPYRRMPDSYHRTVSWITKGIEGEIIGEAGLAYGGAAALMLDRYNLALGTPPHAKIIASSGGHTDNYTVNREDIHYSFPGLYGSTDYRIRADITYFTGPKNGGVFSAGSVAFGMALPANGFDNDAARLLANVVNAFVKPGVLPGRMWTAREKQWR